MNEIAVGNLVFLWLVGHFLVSAVCFSGCGAYTQKFVQHTPLGKIIEHLAWFHRCFSMARGAYREK